MDIFASCLLALMLGIIINCIIDIFKPNYNSFFFENKYNNFNRYYCNTYFYGYS